MVLRPLMLVFLSSALVAQQAPAPKPAPTSQNPPAGRQSAASSTQTAQPSPSDEWEGSSVRSYLLEKSADAFVAPPESLVPRDAPVITIKGLCDNKPASSPDCQTIVTRADFDAMVDAIDPGATTNDRKRMADQYTDLLVRAKRGRQLGLEDTDQYKLTMNFLAMNNLFRLLNHQVLEQARQLTDADLGEFYRANPRLFEEIKTQRIAISQFKAFPPGRGRPTPEQVAAGHAEMKKEAESIAARAALPGADFQALENEGWKFSGSIDDTPDVAQPPLLRWETWPRTRLPIFDLKVGEVSSLIDEPKNGFYVFKIIAKRQVPLEEGRAYIRKRYAGLRYEDVTTRLMGTIKLSLDDRFFGEEAQESAPPGSTGQHPGTEGQKAPSLDIKIPKKMNL